MGGGGGGILSFLAPIQKDVNTAVDPFDLISEHTKNKIGDPAGLYKAPEDAAIPTIISPSSSVDSSTVEAARQKILADAEAARLKKRKGSAATIVTSGMGVPGAAPTRKSTLGE